MVEARDIPPEGAMLPEFQQMMGHPRPLWMLFMTEFWERFAFYGIRWALVLYIVAQFFNGDPSGEKSANQTYGAYLALVYAGAIFGGYVADKVLGYQRSILLGAVIRNTAMPTRSGKKWVRRSSPRQSSTRSLNPPDSWRCLLRRSGSGAKTGRSS